MVQSLFRPWWRLSWLSCLLCAWLCAASAEPAEEPDKPQDFSYALFLQRPRPLTEDMLVQAAARAWELELPAAQKLKISVSAGTGKVRFQGVTFQITMEGTPWLHDQNDFIQAIMDFSNVRHSAALDTGSRPNRAIVNLHVTTRHVLRDHLTA